MVKWDGRASHLFLSDASYRTRSISESGGVHPIYFQTAFQLGNIVDITLKISAFDSPVIGLFKAIETNLIGLD